MIRRFEEISNNAWPALQTIQYDGWLLRFANGVTKRSNSVSLLYPSTINPEEKITFCEKLYEDHGITPCFKITSMADPPDIDHRLENRGYLIHSHISFQTLDISVYSGDQFRGATIETNLNPRWIDDFIRMNDFDPSRRSTYIRIMDLTLTPKCLVSVIKNKKTLGVGLGVIEGNVIGLFDLVVAREFRKTGLGHLIVANILRWGREKGAHTAYLQVLTDNIPAIRLYKKMGFIEQYQYLYRMKPITSAGVPS
ncbi:MAG: GNAT family N-acetyltransferase [Bacteroidales bacterium]|nr:GNAT family N-acetyltransferase [Bacteroidales bacterium]